MPELPDVEIFRQYLNSTSLHQEIDHADILESKMLNVPSQLLHKKLKGRQFHASSRHGKYLFVHLDDDHSLVLHFGMTGFLKYYKNEEEAPKHIRLLIHFTNNYRLAYDCQRKLGRIDLIENLQDFKKKNELGIDALDEQLDFAIFKDRLHGHKGAIKSLLMNQQIIAGIGNIYSDEILFHSYIRPDSAANHLNDKQYQRIYDAMKQVVETAIASHVNPGEFPGDYLLPLRNKNEKCPKCGGKLQSEKINGRTSHFCSNHQKKY